MAEEGNKTLVIHGDNLRLSLESNNRILEIVGDGCRLKVMDNTGKIHMIGDGSRLEIVRKNEGEIEYKGDGGRIILGPGVSLKKALYIGDGGRVGKVPAFKTMENIQKTTGIGLCTASKLKQCMYSPD